MRPEPTEPRNTESLCASCEHLYHNGYYPSMHCYMRDIDIYKGYTKCKDYSMIPDEKIVDIVVEDGRRMRVVMLCPDCTACKHFDYLQKLDLFGDPIEVPWCRRKEAVINPGAPCDDFQ